MNPIDEDIQKRLEELRDIFESEGVPHIKIQVVNDHTPPDKSPVYELATLYELLINQLIGGVVMTNDSTCVALLDHVKMTILNLHFHVTTLLAQQVEEGKKKLTKKEEEETPLPDVFKEVLSKMEEEGKL